MEKITEDLVREKMLRDVQWHITYHTEKLAEAQLQLQILTSKYQDNGKNETDV